MVKEQKKVSIILPVYNASRTIRGTVDSVLRQSYQNYELIIIEDCSRDDSLLIIRQYEQLNPKIRVLANPENKGVAFCRNIGIREASGDYISFLDSDYIWVEDKLHEDYILWLELLKLPVHTVTDTQVLTHYRLIKGSRSRNKFRAASSRWRIYRKFLKMNVFKSAYYFAQYAINGVKKYYT